MIFPQRGTIGKKSCRGITSRYSLRLQAAKTYKPSCSSFIAASTTIPKTFSANTWTNTQAFANLTATNATTTSLNTTVLGLGGLNYFTSLTGSGLTNSGGILTLDRSGDWTGTLDGQDGNYYLANSFSTTSATSPASSYER